MTISRTIAGREVVLSYLSAGNYVGEMALLSQSPRTATVKAAVTTEAVILDADAFKRVLARNPKWRADMEQRFLDRLRINAAMEAAARSRQHHRVPACSRAWARRPTCC